MAEEKKNNASEDAGGKKKKKKKRGRIRRRIWFAIKLVILLFLITVLLLGIAFYMKYGQELLGWQKEARDLIRQSSPATFRQSDTSLVYDADGKQIATLKGEKDTYYIEYGDIPQDAVQAMISIEDKKFETHPGIDLKAIVRAMAAYVANKGEITQGASTITQQLSRNIFLTQEVSWERKIKEIFIALEMEKRYSKEQIMEFYLNNIYFGNGYYGIQAASKGYFSREVGKLDLAEIAFLCAIPNNPTMYDPLDNYDNTIQRKNRIISQMYDDGKISLQEKNDATYEDVELKVKKKKKKIAIEGYIYHSAIEALMENQGFTLRSTFESDDEREEYEKRYDEMYTSCQQSLYSGGYRIYTSIDMGLQKKLQASVDDALAEFTETNDEGTYSLQGAAATIDNATGRIVAIVGGRSQKQSGYSLNRAYQSLRQPGSSIKPLIVYTPAFERGYSPEDIVEDAPVEDGPKNSDGSYSGKITIRSAVERSKNTIAWKMFQEITPAVGLQYLLNMNFSGIDENDYYPAAALGGLTNGVSCVEMASAFATLENDGKFREPTCIVRILDSNGGTVVGEKTVSRPIYSTNAARMMTNVLQGVLIRGTGRGLGLTDMPAAGKTGTTDDKKDGWFVGYTPYYTTSVWVGYDIPKTLQGLSGASYPGRIWHAFMETIHEGLESREFAQYVPVDGKPTEETPSNEGEVQEGDLIDDEEATLPEDFNEPDAENAVDDTPTDAENGNEDDTSPEEENGEDWEGDFPDDETFWEEPEDSDSETPPEDESQGEEPADTDPGEEPGAEPGTESSEDPGAEDLPAEDGVGDTVEEDTIAE